MVKMEGKHTAYGDCSPTKVHSGLQWTTVDYSGLQWTTVDYSGLQWTTVDYSGLQSTPRSTVPVCAILYKPIVNQHYPKHGLQA
jgi:hypothetical protein